MKYLELNDTELGYLLTSITSAMAVIDENGHSLLRPKYQTLYDKVHTVKTSCPAPVLVPSSDKSGAPLYLHASLDESVSSASVLTCDCGSTFYRDDLGSCYDCYFPSDSRDGE